MLDGPAPPRVRVAPGSRANSWEEVADLSATLRMPLDDWQESALEAAMGERADGRWSSKFVGISAPRQNGKSQLIVARALAGVLLFGEKTIIISAHETDTAREVWKRLLGVIEGNPSLERRVTGRMDAINREYVAFGRGPDRQEIRLKARRTSGVRGFSADCLLLDEAQILGKRAWGSIVPTMSAMPNPQLWMFGTPPTPEDDAFAFSRVRDSAMRRKPRHCWLEWSADPGDDFDDPAVWAKANPSYRVRVSREACTDDRAAMDDEQFGMERLGMWADLSASGAFGVGKWKACRVDDRPAGLAVGALGLAVGVDLQRAAVVAAGRDDAGRAHVKPLHFGPDPYSWVVDRLVALAREHDVPVVVDGRGPAAVFIPMLTAMLGDRVRVATTGDVLDACAGIFQAVQAGEVSHCGYSELDAAVAAAVKRNVADRWAWGRRKSGEISPLEAATLALWGLADSQQPSVSVYESRGVLTI